MRRPAVLLILALAVMFGTPGVAYAQQADAAGHVYISAFEDCAFAHAHIDNTGGSPLIWTYASMDWWNTNGSCRATTALARAGTLSVGQDLMYFDVPANRWRYCNFGPWFYNQSTTHDMSTSWAANRPCTSGMYIVNGWARTWNNGWHGGFNQPTQIFVG